MTIYNSQRINRDPWPFHCYDCGHRQENDKDCGHEGVFHDPRSEFDNNPNPLLEAFRWVGGENPEDTESPTEWLDSVLAHGWQESPLDTGYIEHARKVLGRLVAL